MKSSGVASIIVFCLMVFCSSVVLAAENNYTCPEKCNCDIMNVLKCEDITEIPSLEATSLMIEEVLFMNSNIQILTKFPRTYSNVTELEIDNCWINDINDDIFEHMTKLEVLIVTGNKHNLKSLSKASLKPLKNLKKLDLSYNELTVLPDNFFQGLSKLEQLDLGMNSVVLGENLFSGASDNLIKFTCNKCDIKMVPTASLSKIKNLRYLQLNENPFRFLQIDSFKNQNLQDLSLDNCSLSSISSKAFRKLNQLTTLNLGHNLLESIPADAFKYFKKTLKKLYLENNHLASVDENLADWRQLNETKLGGSNPWKCDCDLSWVRGMSFDKVNKDNATCSSPEMVKGQNINKVESNLHCVSKNYLIFLGIGIPILVIGAFVVVCTCMKRRHKEWNETVKYRGLQTDNSQVYNDIVVSSKQSLVA